jgi:hypothetical protein
MRGNGERGTGNGASTSNLFPIPIPRSRFPNGQCPHQARPHPRDTSGAGQRLQHMGRASCQGRGSQSTGPGSLQDSDCESGRRRQRLWKSLAAKDGKPQSNGKASTRGTPDREGSARRTGNPRRCVRSGSNTGNEARKVFFAFFALKRAGARVISRSQHVRRAIHAVSWASTDTAAPCSRPLPSAG